jgi:hypothetical protein
MINASKDRTAAKLYGGSEEEKGKWKRGKGEDNRVAKICAKVTVLDLYQIYQTASPDFPFSTRTASRHFNTIEAMRRCQDWSQTSVSIRCVARFHAYFWGLEIGVIMPRCPDSLFHLAAFCKCSRLYSPSGNVLDLLHYGAYRCQFTFQS